LKRWKIVFDKYSKAVEILYAAVQPNLPYVLVCDNCRDDTFNTIYIGTSPDREGFSVNVSEADGENQDIRITAADETMLMYAAHEFKNVYLPYAAFKAHDPVIAFYNNRLFEKPMPAFEYATKPRIKKRGLWTWGHTVYDYKKYIDNMVRLKFNTLIVWNDYVPINIDDVISYAHQNGIEIYLGFAWGWSTTCGDTDISDTRALTEAVVEKYKSEYASVKCDGIYFQSFTELHSSAIDGISVADAVIEFVNRTADEIYKITPHVKLLFGLHASSVKNDIDKFKRIDGRISIIWEDLGAFPYHDSPYRLKGYDETKELNKKIQSLRDGGFGAVLKSNYRLDWNSFEHQRGRYIMGVSDKRFLRQKLEEKKPLLKNLQAGWIRNAKYAHELIKDFDENALITVLAEDGAFDESISYPVALYSEMLWDSERSTDDIVQTVAQMTDVDFA